MLTYVSRFDGEVWRDARTDAVLSFDEAEARNLDGTLRDCPTKGDVQTAYGLIAMDADGTWHYEIDGEIWGDSIETREEALQAIEDEREKPYDCPRCGTSGLCPECDDSYDRYDRGEVL